MDPPVIRLRIAQGEVCILGKQMAVMELRTRMAEKEAECEKLNREVASTYAQACVI